MPTPRRRALALVAALAAGCGGPPASHPDPEFDPGRARDVLVAALDAWKAGRARELERREPPIRLVDEDLRSAFRLVDYRLEEPDAPVLPYTAVPVELTLRPVRGEPVTRKAGYQVTLGPRPSVLRAD